MKGGGPILIVLLLTVVSVLGYFNLKQNQTIQLLNEEILEQARQRHNLILKKHVLEQKLEALKQEPLTVDSTTLVMQSE